MPNPLLALVHDAVDATTFIIEEGHESTARSVVGALSMAGLETPVKQVDGVRRVITRGVLGTVRRVNRTVETVGEVVLPEFDVNPPEVPLRADAVVSPLGAADQLVGVLNGVVGDHLADTRNGFDLGLELRHTEAVPTSRIVVLVHGLSTTELSWSLQADEAFGDPSANYGTLLQDQGFTPLFVRYNTGRPIADNGAALSRALGQLLLEWPVEVEQIVLIGHSMGGLVSRAATAGAPGWTRHLTDMVCLGSPHAGAPLARLGERATRILRTVDLPATQVLGRILDRRSRGVKDLRQGVDGPLLPHVRYLLVAGSMTADADAFGTAWLGDGLVPVSSATAPQGQQVTVRHVGGAMHHRLQTHAAVYAVIREQLGG